MPVNSATKVYRSIARLALGDWAYPPCQKTTSPLPTSLIPPGNGQNPYGQQPYEVPLCTSGRYPYATFRGTPKGGGRGTSQRWLGVPQLNDRGTQMEGVGVPKRGVAQPYFAFCHLRESFLPVGIASLGRERKGKIPSVDFVRFVANNHQVTAVTRDA